MLCVECVLRLADARAQRLASEIALSEMQHEAAVARRQAAQAELALQVQEADRGGSIKYKV